MSYDYDLGFSEVDLEIGNSEFDLLGNDRASTPDGFSAPSAPSTSGLLATTSLTSPAFATASNASNGTPLQDARSSLTDFSNNLGTLQNTVEDVRDGVTFAKETAETIGEALGVFGEIAEAADTVADVVTGFKNVTKLLSKVSFLRNLANRLDDVFDDIADTFREIESRAKRIDKKLEDPRNDVNDIATELSNYEMGLDIAIDRIGGFRSSVDSANAVLNRLPDAEAGEENGFEGALSGLLDPLNADFLGVGGLQDFLSGVSGRLGDVNNLFGDIGGALQGALDISDKIGSVAGELDFLQAPLNILNDALSPISGILDAADFVFNLFVAPILDPILEALGIEALFDSIEAELRGLLPNVSITGLTDIEVDLEALFGDLDLELIEGIFDADLGFDALTNLLDDFLGPVESANEGLIIVTDDETNGLGEDGSDLIAGNDLDNELRGQSGDDVFSVGQGDDVVFGGFGDDTAVFDAPITEFTLTQDTKTNQFIVSHTDPSSPDLDFGTNTLTDVEFYVFSDGTRFSQEDLANIVNLSSQSGADFDGTADADFVIGDSRDNEIEGRGGDDFLAGGGGFDVLRGGAGDDTLLLTADAIGLFDGGAGFDTATYSGSSTAVQVVLLGFNLIGDLTVPNNAFYELINIERLVGGDEDDALYGDFGVNIIEGGRGGDVIRGLAGDDLLSGGEGQDFLFGDLGNDTLVGDAGDDFLTSGAGDDILEGGAGYDTAYYGRAGVPPVFEDVLDETDYLSQPSYSGIPDYIEYDGTAGTVEKYDVDGVSLGTDTLDGIEVIRGGDGDNTLNGGAHAEVLVGGAGDDEIRLNGSGDGEDGFFGGFGNDTVYLSGTGSERGNLGRGDENYFIFDNSEILSEDYSLQITSALGDRDVLDFSASAHAVTNIPEDFFEPLDVNQLTLANTLGIDVSITLSTSRIEVLYGSNLNDEIKFGDSSLDDSVLLNIETFYGGEGNDRAIAHTLDGGMIFYGEAGNDSLELRQTGGEAYGGTGNDILTVLGRGSDGPGVQDFVLDGGEGDDFLGVSNISAGSTGIVDGGNGSDTLFLLGVGGQGNNVGGNIHLGDQSYSNSLSTMGGAFVIENIENVVGSFFDDTIFATESANLVIGGRGNDTLDGLAGDDIIFGGLGNDEIIGGAGNDVLGVGDASGSSVQVDIVDGGDGVDTLTFAFIADHRPEQKIPFLFTHPDVVDGFVHADLDAGTSAFFKVTDPSGNSPDTATIANVENLIGTNRNDMLRGSVGDNTLSGSGGDDDLFGLAGDDALIGGDGNDRLDGGSGNDLFASGLGSDAYYGGAGEDRIDFTAADVGTLVNLAEGTARTASTFTNIQWADGGSEPRDFTYRPFNGEVEVTVSLTPEEIFRSNRSNVQNADDIARADDGGFSQALSLLNSGTIDADGNYTPGFLEISFVDTVEINQHTVSGIENVTGGDGADTLIGSSVSNILNGGAGNDILYGDASMFSEEFGFANLNIGGQSQLADGSYGGSVTDYLLVDSLDTINGGAFTIELLYQSSEIAPAGGEQYYFSYAVGSNPNELLLGSYNSELYLRVGDYDVFTGVSSDVLHNGALHRISLSYEVFASGGESRGVATIYIDGEEVFSTGLGVTNFAIETGGQFVIGQEFDLAGIDSFNADQILSGSVGDIRLWDGARSASEILDNAFTSIDPSDTALIENWTFDNGIENVAGDTAITLTGGSLIELGSRDDDILFGGAGDDELFGGRGADTLDGGSGADILDGGRGTDVASYTGSDAAVTIKLAAQIASGGDATGDVLLDIENISGSAFGDALTGDDGANLLRGNNGDDRLIGRGGEDELLGGTGNDQLFGNGDDDTINGASGADLIDGGTGEDFINGGSGRDVLRGNLDADTILGGTGDDIILGGNGFDVINGGGDNDFVDGGGGNDMINGGIGNDELRGNVGADTIDGGDGNDTLLGGRGFDTLIGGNGFDILRGGNGDDILNGSNGDDNLAGQVGRDTLIGGSGDDLMTGGINRDTFVFDTAAWGNDTIADFENGLDILNLQGSGATSVADLLISQDGSHTLIEFGNSSITLRNTDAASIDDADFIF